MKILFWIHQITDNGRGQCCQFGQSKSSFYEQGSPECVASTEAVKPRPPELHMTTNRGTFVLARGNMSLLATALKVLVSELVLGAKLT